MTNTITAPTRPKAPRPAKSGIGCDHGIASQVSLPNMLESPSTWRWRSGPWRQFLHYDLVEQARLDGRVGERSDVHALHREILVGLRAQRRPAAVAGLLGPGVKIRFRHRLGLEIHIGEAVAAEHRGEAHERAGFMGVQVERRRHAVHRVDHAAELWDEEGVHHARGRQAEANRNPGGNDEAVHAGDVLVGVDEQPFPVERYALNVDWLLV